MPRTILTPLPSRGSECARGMASKPRMMTVMAGDNRHCNSAMDSLFPFLNKSADETEFIFFFVELSTYISTIDSLYTDNVNNLKPVL